MCIRDSLEPLPGLRLARGPRLRRRRTRRPREPRGRRLGHPCLLYTSDAADERSSVDLGGRRIIKKKNKRYGGGRKSIAHTNRATGRLKERHKIDTDRMNKNR